MALPLPTGLLELLSAEVRAPIELITLMGQCDLAHLKGIVVSSGELFEFAFDRQRQAVQLWPRLHIGRLCMKAV
jgi:hypothetical protein